MITRFLLGAMDRRGQVFLIVLLGLAVLVPLANLLGLWIVALGEWPRQGSRSS